jgi:DNA primase
MGMFGVGWDGEAYTIPMFNEDFLSIGVQRRWPNAVKGNKCCVSGSMLGLFLPIEIRSSTIFICEGASDAIAVYDLGFDAIGRPSCNSCVEIVCQWVGINEDIKHIIIIPDNDEVGKDGAKELHKCLNMDFGEITDIFEYAGAKDIRELISVKGRDAVRKMLNEYV